MIIEDGRYAMNNKKITGILALIMSAALAVCMTGCGDKDKTDTSSNAAEESYDDSDDYEYYDEDDGDADYEFPDEDYEMDNIGITFHLPKQYLNTIGSVEFYDFDVTGYGEIFYCEADYIGLSQDEYSDDHISDSAAESYNENSVPVFGVVAITGNRTAEDLSKVISEYLEDGIGADDLKPVGSDEGVNFFECTKLDTTDYNNLGADYKSEYDELVALKDSILSDAKYSRPSDAVDPDTDSSADADDDADKISFTTEDLDGNTISSDDIFSQHEITMINVWATWCPYCTGELPELEEINNRLVEKNCAIVGLCGDADDDINLAKKMLDEFGVTYLNIRTFDGMGDIFDMDNGWPTSFFVNKKGEIVSEPLTGAQVDAYEGIIDKLLNGGASPRIQKTNSYANSDNLYRIRVVDDSLQPVEGVMVQFCSDENCSMGVTGSDGTTTFDNPPGKYEVHVRKVPAGFEENTTTYTTEDQYSDMVIVIERD